jgi:hypothetical protein
MMDEVKRERSLPDFERVILEFVLERGGASIHDIFSESEIPPFTGIIEDALKKLMREKLVEVEEDHSQHRGYWIWRAVDVSAEAKGQALERAS